MIFNVNYNAPTSTNMIILANGNVGIGTTNSLQSLNACTDNTSINNTNTTREAGIQLDRYRTIWDTLNKGFGFTTSVNNLSIQSSLVTSKLEITQSGNICIGENANLNCKLYVNAGIATV